MSGLAKFLGEHTAFLFLAVILWNVAIFAWRYFRGRQSNVSFPSPDSVCILFHESMASDASNGNTSPGRDHGRLRVTVTDEELWIQPSFRFRPRAPEDLQLRVARSSITSATVDDTDVSPRVVLVFRLPDGKSRTVWLGLGDPGGFVAALTYQFPEAGLRRSA